MGEAIGQTLPLAVGVAISPLGIVAAVLMLTTGRGGNGLAFLFGWFAGLVVFGTALLLGRGADASSAGEPADWTGYARIAFGLMLLVLAHRQWTGSRAGTEAATPAWMDKLATFSPVRAIGLGAALGAINPKNLVLTLGAAAAIAGLGASTVDQAIALLTYAVIGSLGAAVPVGIYLFTGDRADQLLAGLKDRMARNNGVIMAVICLVIAAKLIGDGITTLSLF